MVVARLEREPVRALNRTVRAHREQRPTAELRRALRPIAERILHVVENAAEQLAPGPLRIDAHLEGGELEGRFELYRCVTGSERPSWSREAEWKATIGEEREERVAGLTLPLRSHGLVRLPARGPPYLRNQGRRAAARRRAGAEALLTELDRRHRLFDLGEHRLDPVIACRRTWWGGGAVERRRALAELFVPLQPGREEAPVGRELR